MFGFTEVDHLPEDSSAIAKVLSRNPHPAFHPALAQEEHEDPETKIHAIREWALSLHTRRRDNHVSSSSAAMPTLPPLPAIKDYPPGGMIASSRPNTHTGSRPNTSRSATKPSKKAFGPVEKHELLGEYAVVQIMKAQGADEFNPVKPPKASSLGVTIPRSLGKPTVSAPSPSFYSTYGGMSGEDFTPKSGSRGRPMKVVNLAHFGGQGVVRGFDPMGGTLFGLDAKLDRDTRRHGLYEGSLKRQASPGRGTQLPVNTQPQLPTPMQQAAMHQGPTSARLTFTGPI
eukprot:gnl/MRDRNA2_/MRDRNA2_29385_c0_seq1.p1 gnl/MRDRNA2_/MRDRNA2_29385_c0~~gnl/MRDRNA2_/MRDRNA2_29385_c0_seq1.p1  ORF type:complete len:286 (+),score=39.67 gnl/MRDRNA2_/MRDRNA2_29385_c0_seq1:32-889(+)